MAKLCKLSHIRETKEERRARLDARRERQLSLRSSTSSLHMAGDREELIALRQRFWAGQIGYRPHQGQSERHRREKQIVLAWASAP